MSYNQNKLYTNNKKMMDCEWPLGMIDFSLTLHHNMGMKYAGEAFNVGMFFLYLRHPSKWVHFRPPTHTSGHFYTARTTTLIGEVPHGIIVKEFRL